MAGAVFVLGLLSLLLGPTRSLAAAIVVPKVTGDVFIDDDGVDVRDRHVVLLKPSADLDQHLQYVHASFQTDGYEGITHNYSFHDFKAYAGHFHSSFVQHLQNHADVAIVEPDHIWRPAGIREQTDAEWGLVSISQKATPKQDDKIYFYDSSGGTGTFAYVVDSGIQVNHEEFEGRAVRGYNAIKPTSKQFNDVSGHGTHVAGIIGSKTYGVDKNCQLIAVKVISRETSTLSKILDGFEWAVKDIYSQRRKTRAVINVSVWGPRSETFNHAVDASTTKGVTTVVAAGNNKMDAAQKSPASAKSAITVSATDEARAAAEFANWGHVVDLYAPGVKIKSTWIGSNTATQVYSGTSQSSAFVAGLVIYFKGLYVLPDSKTTLMAIMGNAIHDSVIPQKGPKVPFAYNGSGR